MMLPAGFAIKQISVINDFYSQNRCLFWVKWLNLRIFF